MPPKTTSINVEISKVFESCAPFQKLWRDGVITPGKIELYICLKLPDDGDSKPGAKPIDPKNLEKEAKKCVEGIRKKIVQTLEEAAKDVKAAFDAKDYKKAKNALEKADKHIESLLEDTPGEVRQAVARRSPFRPDDFSTVNDLTFKESDVSRKNFPNVAVLDEPPDYKSELKSLWSNSKPEPLKCLLFIEGQESVVLLGFKTSPKKADWKKYFDEEPDTILEGDLEPLAADFTAKATGNLKTKTIPLAKALKAQGGLDIKFE